MVEQIKSVLRSIYSIILGKAKLSEILIGLLVLAIFFYIMHLFSQRREYMIKIHKKVIPAKVKYVRRKCLYMKYKIGDTEMESCFGSPKPKCNVVGSELLLVFDTLDTENAQLLILPEDFEKFGLAIPDSLSWTKGCFQSGFQW